MRAERAALPMLPLLPRSLLGACLPSLSSLLRPSCGVVLLLA